MEERILAPTSHLWPVADHVSHSSIPPASRALRSAPGDSRCLHWWKRQPKAADDCYYFTPANAPPATASTPRTATIRSSHAFSSHTSSLRHVNLRRTWVRACIMDGCQSNLVPVLISQALSSLTLGYGVANISTLAITSTFFITSQSLHERLQKDHTDLFSLCLC